MKSWMRLAIVCALLPVSNLSLAVDASPVPSESMHWRCWYDQQTHISCLIDIVPPTGNAAMESLPADLPQVVKLMRSNPAALRNRFIHIPLFSAPYGDMEFTATLAKAAVCGTRRDCTVNFTRTPPRDEEIIALLYRNAPAADRNGAREIAMSDDE